MERVNELISTLNNASESSEEAETYECTVSPLRSLHFTLSCALPRRNATTQPFFALLRLPATLFVDRYELLQRVQDPTALSFSPKNYEIYGETNLELPVASGKLDARGSAILMLLRNNLEKLEIPIHARYLLPKVEGNNAAKRVEFSPIILFSASGGHPKPEHLLTPPSWGAYEFVRNALAPSSPKMLEVEIPAGTAGHLSFVEPITAVAILLCFFYVVLCVWGWQTTLQNPPKSKSKTS